MVSDKFVNANGLRLHYLDYGNDGAPWVVCVHGLTQNAHNFDALAPHLAAKYHVISVDVRGRGDSQWGPPTEYLPQNYVTDLAKMLEELGVAPTSPGMPGSIPVRRGPWQVMHGGTCLLASPEIASVAPREITEAAAVVCCFAWKGGRSFAKCSAMSLR